MTRCHLPTWRGDPKEPRPDQDRNAPALVAPRPSRSIVPRAGRRPAAATTRGAPSGGRRPPRAARRGLAAWAVPSFRHRVTMERLRKQLLKAMQETEGFQLV